MSNEERNAEQIQADEKYYEVFLDLFASEGWKQLTEELTITRATQNDVSTTPNADELFYRRGQLNIIDNLLNFETTIKFALEQMNEEVDNSDADN